MEELPELAQLNESEKDQLIRSLWSELERLRARIKELEGQQKKDSRTSGKPPSTDGLKKKPRTKSLRRRSGRSPGGQPGHEGHSLEAVAEPDQIHWHDPAHCHQCGKSLQRQPRASYSERQVFEVPPLKIEVTAHRASLKSCPHCAVLSEGVFPADVTNVVQYGSRLKALSVYLRSYQLLPYERQSDWFEDVLGHRLTLQRTLYREAKLSYKNRLR
jgi:transposase